MTGLSHRTTLRVEWLEYRQSVSKVSQSLHRESVVTYERRRLHSRVADDIIRYGERPAAVADEGQWRRGRSTDRQKILTLISPEPDSDEISCLSRSRDHLLAAKIIVR